MAKLTPTDEQAHIFDCAGTTSLLKVEALAGTGKTSTLEMLSHRLRGRGLYLAFNRAIAMEAKRRFSNKVECRTFHSLAFITMAKLIVHRLEGKDNGTLSPIRVRSTLQLTALGPLSGMSRAGLALRTFDQFLYSADPMVGPQHVNEESLLPIAQSFNWSEGDIANIKTTLADDAQRLWEAMWAKNSEVVVTHDAYLKAYALQSPTLAYDYLEIDEAQDMNPMMLQLLRQQDSPIILVGDTMQSIYAYRGAENALTRLRRSDQKTCFLTRSFRFGDDIAARANVVLGNLNAARPIRGFETNRDHLTAPHAYLYRSNLGLFGGVLKHCRESNAPFTIAGGTKEMVSLLHGVDQLLQGKPARHPEFAGFESWNSYRVASEQPGASEDMKRLVKLVKQYPRKSLMGVLRAGDETNKKVTQIVFSTAHKSKGREWPIVTLGDDFEVPDSSALVEIDKDEARLAYVAFTRAQRQLNGDRELANAYANRLRSIANAGAPEQQLGTLVKQLRSMDNNAQQQAIKKLSAAEHQSLLAYLRQQ